MLFWEAMAIKLFSCLSMNMCWSCAEKPAVIVTHIPSASKSPRRISVLPKHISYWPMEDDKLFMSSADENKIRFVTAMFGEHNSHKLGLLAKNSN